MGKNNPPDADALLRAYLELDETPSTVAPVRVKPDPLSELGDTWREAVRKMDQALLHYAAAKHAVDQTAGDKSLMTALEQHDRALASLSKAAAACGHQLAQIWKLLKQPGAPGA